MQTGAEKFESRFLQISKHRSPPQASSAEQSRPSHVGQTSAPPSVSNGTLTLSETSTQMEARKPTTNGSVPTSAFPGGGADATPKPMDSSVQAEQPSADSSGESTKYIKNDLVPDSQTSEHAQQTGPLIQANRESARGAALRSSVDQMFPNKTSNVTEPEKMINHPLEDEDVEQLQPVGSQPLEQNGIRVSSGDLHLQES